MTDREFERVEQFIGNRCGIDLTNKKVLVEGRIETYLLRNDMGNMISFMDQVEKDVTGKLAEALVNIITTNHTYFMREFEHLTFLKQVILPELKQRCQNTRDLRIWCGASSTGEEPYMIAMVLSDFFGLDKANWDTTVLATDISTDVLKTAQKGIYTEEQVKNIPPTWLSHYFRRNARGQYSVTEELKKEVLFRQFNLMNPFPFRQQLHVVFMRNVMIYFNKQTKQKLLNQIYDVLEPGGYLFLGTTESIDRGSTGFQYVQPSIFRKEGRKEA